MTTVSLADFQSFFEESVGTLENLLDDQEDAVFELFDTGSAEFYVADKCYIFVLTIFEKKPN